MKNRKMKIAMIIDSYDNASNGAVVSTRRFVSLLRQEHSVKVITGGELHEDHIGLPAMNIPLFGSKIDKMGFSFARPDRRILRSIIEWADIVHVQFPFFLGRAAINLCREMNKPVITSFHVQPENMLFNVGIRSGRLIELFYRFYIKNFYNRSSSVICPTEFAASELKKRGLKTKTTVVSNGILPEFTPLHSSERKKTGNHFTILSVGRMAKEKNHEILIEAIKRSHYRDRINLIISGKGPLKNQLRRQARGLYNAPIIDFLPYAQLIQAYQNADLYVHSSEVELESMTVLEAMACGLPPLIADSKYSAAPGFALNSMFLFESNSAADLARRIDYWMEHENELETCRYRYAREASKFRIEKSLEKLTGIYKNAIEDKVTGRDLSLLKGGGIKVYPSTLKEGSSI